MTGNQTLFKESLPLGVEGYLSSANPWWQNKPMRELPEYRRWLFDHALQRLKSGVAPVTVIRGPRQVGKTTIQEQIIHHLLYEEGVDPLRIFRVQFDEIPSMKGIKDTILSFSRWFENKVAKQTFNELARKKQPAFLFFDEVQNLDDWAPQVKALVDHNSVKVLLTGSSALRIERGRDSLAGRISTLDLGTLLLREISSLRGFGDLKPIIPFNGLGDLKEKRFWETVRSNGSDNKETRDKAFAAFSERGGYPVAQVRSDRPWEEVADQLNETVIKRVIQHDLRLGDRGQKRDQNLLEELFRLCCRYTGQAPSQAIFLSELKTAFLGNLGWQRVLAYLRFLNDTLLIRMVNPLELRLKKRKGRSKICICDHSLRASWLQEIIPIAPEALQKSTHLTDLAGHIAESVAGYFLSSIPGLDIAWFPERGEEPEVDFIIIVGENRIPVEIKYQRTIDSHRDTLGLRAFIERTAYNAPFGVLVTLNDDVKIDDPRIVSLPLSSLLLMR